MKYDKKNVKEKSFIIILILSLYAEPPTTCKKMKSIFFSLFQTLQLMNKFYFILTRGSMINDSFLIGKCVVVISLYICPFSKIFSTILSILDLKANVKILSLLLKTCIVELWNPMSRILLMGLDEFHSIHRGSIPLRHVMDWMSRWWFARPINLRKCVKFCWDFPCVWAFLDSFGIIGRWLFPLKKELWNPTEWSHQCWKSISLNPG